MTIQVDDPSPQKVEVAAGALATAEPYVHRAIRVTVPWRSALAGFYVITDSVTCQLKLVGEFDLACGDRFRDASAATLAGDATEAVVDFKHLLFIDSRGIEILAEFRNSLAVRGATLRIINSGARIRRVFAICGLDGMLTDREVSRHEMSRSQTRQADVAWSGEFLDSGQQTGDQ